MEQIPFVSSTSATLGIELELQLVNPSTHDLIGLSSELIDQLPDHPASKRVKPELTRSMIELNSAVHEHPAGLLADMTEMRDLVRQAAHRVGARLSGGGTHPFMNWQDRKIFDTPRFQAFAERFGYLAPQFTVFGQHIHLGVASGDEAIAMIRRLEPYMPHFIALSASSPFSSGIDTRFDCSRLNAVGVFPLSGSMPDGIQRWADFECHVGALLECGLATGLKDLYWDMRPKPEYGTVEIRVCDTPLTVDKACQLGAFAQALSIWVMRQPEPGPYAQLAYRNNRFHACRYGWDATYIAHDASRMLLSDHMFWLFDQVMPVAEELGSTEMVAALHDGFQAQGNDAEWLRQVYGLEQDLSTMVERMADCFEQSSLVMQ